MHIAYRTSFIEKRVLQCCTTLVTYRGSEDHAGRADQRDRANLFEQLLSHLKFDRHLLELGGRAAT